MSHDYVALSLNAENTCDCVDKAPSIPYLFVIVGHISSV